MTVRISALVLGAICILGCGSSHPALKSMQQPAAGVTVLYHVEAIADPKGLAPEDMRDALHLRLQQELGAKRLLAKDRDEADRLVQVTITSFRMRDFFTRAIFGFMAGNDSMGANVRVRDAFTSEVVGESEVSCHSDFRGSGLGEDLIRTEGEKIAKYLSEMRK